MAIKAKILIFKTIFTQGSTYIYQTFSVFV